MPHTTMQLNTSNLGKYEEFKCLLANYGVELEASHIDLREIDADDIKVVAHKASQLESVIVDDTSLEVEGASVGVNVRWLLNHLSDYVGRKAEWVVLLGVRRGDNVFIYKGSVPGIIVEARGATGYGFDPVFLPDGAKETLAQSKPDKFNPRAIAVDALINDKVWMTHPVIENWDGPWQT